MNKVFLKAGQVELKNGGYLVSTGKNELPVVHTELFKALEQAKRLIVLAEKVKGKDFIGKQADRLEDVYAEVDKELSKKSVIYVEQPKEVSQEITNKLVEEAFAFMNFAETSCKTDKINGFLQQYNVIKKFEEVGLYFEYNDTEVNFDKIYTIAEITEAAKVVIDLI